MEMISLRKKQNSEVHALHLVGMYRVTSTTETWRAGIQSWQEGFQQIWVRVVLYCWKIANVVATFKKREINLAKYQTIIPVSIVHSTSGGQKELKKELLGNGLIRILDWPEAGFVRLISYYLWSSSDCFSLCTVSNILVMWNMLTNLDILGISRETEWWTCTRQETSKFRLKGSCLTNGKLLTGVRAEARLAQDTAYTVAILKCSLNARKKFQRTASFCVRLLRRI